MIAPDLRSLPPIPSEAQHLWDWFVDLGGQRTAGMSVNPISWADMHAYFALRRLTPERWEVEAIRALDAAYLRSRAEEGGPVIKGARALKGALRRE